MKSILKFLSGNYLLLADGGVAYPGSSVNFPNPNLRIPYLITSIDRQNNMISYEHNGLLFSNDRLEIFDKKAILHK